MWHLTSRKTGVSALGLQRALGLGSCEAVWALSHKLRRAMVRPGRDRLTGTVQVDETYWGGPDEGVTGRPNHNKALIIVAAEQDDQGIGRVRLRHIPDVTQATLPAFIAQAVESRPAKRSAPMGSGPILAWLATRTIGVCRGHPPRAAGKLLPRVLRVVALLKRWLLGTHQGASRHAYIDD